MKKIKFKIPPQIYILISFLVVILICSICLVLPFSTKDGRGLKFIDALFVSTSATCVTGLSTISLQSLSVFGIVVVTFAIEIGGLSFLTLATFIYSLFSKMSISNNLLMKEALNSDSFGEITSTIKKIIFISFVIQILGAINYFLIFIIKYHYSFLKSLGFGIFHSVSAFNNAGFDLFGNTSLIEFSNDVFFNINTMLLITLGGLGFLVIYEVVNKRRWKKFSLNTKIVLIMSISLTLGGMLFLKLSLYDQITWLEALFQSVTCRTAGFYTFDLTTLNTPSYIVMISLMFIGASPCSTGGGLKTTTLFVIFLTLTHFIREDKVTFNKRKISEKVQKKAFTIFSLEIIYIMISSFLISLFDRNVSYNRILFEVVSSFATVGLSLNLTSSLSIASKIILIINMFVGRLGVLTILSLTTNNKIKIKDKYFQYVEENVIIG